MVVSGSMVEVDLWVVWSAFLDHLEDYQGDEHEEQQAHQNGRRHGWTNEREGEDGNRCGTASTR